MPSELRMPYLTYGAIMNNQLYSDLRVNLLRNPVQVELRDYSIIPLIGPLNTAERWALLTAYRLERTRAAIPLEGSALSVAVSMLKSVVAPQAYPDDLLLLQMIHLESQRNEEVGILGGAHFVRAITELLRPRT